MKILNKNAGQAKSHNIETCTIAMISPKIFCYFSLYCENRVTRQQYTSTDSYLDIDRNFTWKKIKTKQRCTIFCFQTQDDLHLLRNIQGFGSTYGSLENRPTLSDGDSGVVLKPGHHLSVVNGLSGGHELPLKFKRYSCNPRVDLAWNEYSARIVVCFTLYRYNINNDGSLLRPPPTQHLNGVLNGLVNHHSQPPCALESSRTTNKIAPSEDSNEDTTSSTTQSQKQIHQPCVFIRDQFCMDGTVYEVIDIPPLSGTACCIMMGGNLYNNNVDDSEQEMFFPYQ